MYVFCGNDLRQFCLFGKSAEHVDFALQDSQRSLQLAARHETSVQELVRLVEFWVHLDCLIQMHLCFVEMTLHDVDRRLANMERRLLLAGFHEAHGFIVRLNGLVGFVLTDEQLSAR